MELAGKTALVTGSARRLGKSIALALARAGADVALHCHRSITDAAQTREEIAALGRRAEVFPADLADPRQIEELFAAVARSFPRLDVLVNNAAVYAPTPIESLTAEQWDAQSAVNARAPALCIRHAIALMPAGGAIVNIADSSGPSGRADYTAYCASKAALAALTRSTALSLARRNIRVNTVSPGVALWHQNATESEKSAVIAQIPMKRAGTGDDVASAVLFLIRSDYITGQDLRVDGGWHMA